MKQLSVIIPAFNEELSISSTVPAVQNMLSSSGIQGEVIVVDDGSQDATRKAGFGGRSQGDRPLRRIMGTALR